MKLRYKLLKDGSFVAGDAETGLTGYAYPTSVHAMDAKRHPIKTAEKMIKGEMWRYGKSIHPGIRSNDYDASNWKLITLNP